jgi:hypothetical protein
LQRLREELLDALALRRVSSRNGVELAALVDWEELIAGR